MVNENLSVKHILLKALRKGAVNGEAVSGESIALECGVSRTAVWKAVQSLSAFGYKIAGGASGYVLQKDVQDSICPWEFGEQEKLFCYFGTTDSTMVQARKIVQEIQKGERIKIVVADRQTKGVGQQGRSWKTVRGSLAFTLATKNELPVVLSRRAVMACQIALVNVLEKHSHRSFAVRWPNDVWSESGKVAGVLDELSANGGVCSWQNLGVGINVSSRPGIPQADSVFKKAEGGMRRKIISDFIREYALLKDEVASCTQDLSRHWNSLCPDVGKEFYAKDSGAKVVFCGVDAYGSALLKNGAGCTAAPAGSVRLKK